MILQITKALSRGFTSKQIIDYLLKKFPNHSDKIKEALAAGFTVDQVVKYLGGGKKALNQMAPISSTETGVNSEFAQIRQKQTEKNKAENQVVTAGAAGLAGAGLGASMASSALTRAVPSNLLGYIPGTRPGPQSNPLTSQSPMGPGPNSPGINVMPQAPKPPMAASPNQPTPQSIPRPPQPIQPQRDVNKSVDIIKSTGHEATVKNLLEGGLSPTDIKDTLGQIMGKKKLKELEKETGGIEQAIEDYASTIVQKLQETPLETAEIPNEQSTTDLLPKPTEFVEEPIEEEKPKPIAKKETVATPQGIGQIKEIRNGKALVEVDGKLHKVEESDLVQSPLPMEELADLHDNLIKGIEQHTGKEVSKNVEWAGYDPKLNELAYKPWSGGGKVYIYSDISPEDKDELLSILAERKTSGSNYIGAWEKDTKSPIGNRMHALIMRLQKERGGKGNEYRTKFETIYDPLEPAKNASKERYKNEQKRKKARQ